MTTRTLFFLLAQWFSLLRLEISFWVFRRDPLIDLGEQQPRSDTKSDGASDFVFKEALATQRELRASGLRQVGISSRPFCGTQLMKMYVPLQEIKSLGVPTGHVWCLYGEASCPAHMLWRRRRRRGCVE